MIEFVVASLLASLTVGYWLLCRSRSLPLRERASQLVAEYIERDDISMEDAQSAFGAYFMSTKWWFMPIAVILSLFIIPYIALFSKPGGNQTPPDKRKIISSCMLFHVVRNPITSVLGLSAMFIWAAVFIAGGLLTRRITAIPSFGQVLDILSMLRPEKDKHAH